MKPGRHDVPQSLRGLGGKLAPVIDGLTGDRRFFLGYAQSWRQKQTDDSVRQQIVSNPPPAAQYQVNGVVRWMHGTTLSPIEKDLSRDTGYAGEHVGIP
jgi:hypothetical protein